MNISYSTPAYALSTIIIVVASKKNHAIKTVQYGITVR
jgi:hypothetical protein